MNGPSGPAPDTDLVVFARQVYARLLDYYGEPTWRMALSPLDELVSTILSQNTNDRNRDQAYESLHVSFTTWELVRDAEPRQVVAAIRSA